MAGSTFDALVHRTRIGQFVSVGVIGATIETIIVAILTTAGGLGPLVSKAIGAETSISTMFVINDRWTFDGHGAVGVLAFVRRWIKSHFVRAGGLSVGFLVLFALTDFLQVELLFAGMDLWPTVANGIGIGAGMFVNYVAESVITWRVLDNDG